MIKLCAVDLDGTLFDNKKIISFENKTAIAEAQKKGVKIVIASGRPYAGVLPVLKELNLYHQDYVICYNGAKVIQTKTKESIFSSTISGKEIKELYLLSKKLGSNFHAFTSDEKLLTDIINPYTDLEASINHMKYQVVNICSIQDDDTFIKGMFVGAEQTISSCIRALDPAIKKRFSVVRSSKYFLEFLHPSTNKGTALTVLANHLGFSMDEVMAIGDAGNDLAMIKMAGIGVAMENAFPEIKKAATNLTASNEASGVAKAINKFILG